MTTISDITAALEAWAPRPSQQSYDNVGLQVGDASATINRTLIALDLTPAVIDEAIETGAQLIITHHPLIFRPQKAITTADWNGSLILRLAKAGIALYCIHTNLDAARDGVSFALAKQIGLQKVDFLRPLPESLVKLVTFVPAEHLESVRQALAEAGAGRIGRYEACAFGSKGTGFFKATEGTDPFIGDADGKMTSTEEWRLEVEVERWRIASVVEALKKAHPYEEVAYDVYPVLNSGTQTGMGAIGEFETPVPLSTFLKKTAKALATDSFRYVGDSAMPVQRIAVCGGSGADLIGDALRAGADAYLTADVTYHRFFEALATDGTPRMALIDVMHYESEACTERLLVDWLSERFEAVTWMKTRHRTSPIQTFGG